MFDRRLARKQIASLFGVIVSFVLLLQARSGVVIGVPFCSLSGFAPPRTYTPPNFDAISVTTGDFNGDGRPDIATGASAPGGISVLLNDGAGGFGLPTIYSIFASHTDITTGDFQR